MRRLTSLCLFALLLLASPAAARPVVGIGDQDAAMFSDPAFRVLDVKHSRLTLAWDWNKDPYTIALTDQWMAAARAAGVRPLIAFNRNWRKGGEKVLPSMRAYRRSFRAFRGRYPDVRDFSAWNEANHPSQPTFNRPRAAARFYNAMRSSCPRCRIVAADVLDSRTMLPWIAKFKRYARTPRIWGLHNYKDANDGGSDHTKALLKAVRGQVWLTETGGIRRLKPHPGSKGRGRRHTYSQQASAVRRIYKLARTHRRITRVYFYEWRAKRNNRWDSALLDHRGKRRPAYRAVRQGLRAARR
jgi:polysaccharide biosynthesis protein PslG